MRLQSINNSNYKQNQHKQHFGAVTHKMQGKFGQAGKESLLSIAERSFTEFSRGKQDLLTAGQDKSGNEFLVFFSKQSGADETCAINIRNRITKFHSGTQEELDAKLKAVKIVPDEEAKKLVANAIEDYANVGGIPFIERAWINLCNWVGYKKVN